MGSAVSISVVIVVSRVRVTVVIVIESRNVALLLLPKTYFSVIPANIIISAIIVLYIL